MSKRLREVAEGPRFRRRDWIGVALALSAFGILAARSCAPEPVYAEWEDYGPPHVPVDMDSLVAYVLAGSPEEGFTAPKPCWPARRCPDFYLAHTVRSLSEWYDVSPTRIARLIWVESRGDSMALGRPIRVRVGDRLITTRAVGLGQIVPELWLGVFPECGTDLHSVRDNVCHTVRIWRYYKDHHHPDINGALLAYNGCRSEHCDWYDDAILGF